MTRSAGILLPLFSLPGAAGTGALGETARAFADFLAEAGCGWWQMLPINPIDHCHSPYSSSSAFAGEPLYLDLNELADEGLLPSESLPCGNTKNSRTADYEYARSVRAPLWREAFAQYRNGGGAKYRAHEEAFRETNRFWLNDYALFCVLADRFRTPAWQEWPEEFRRRDRQALDEIRNTEREDLEFHIFLQLVFDTQWREFKAYCNAKKVRILGDVPIYVGLTSADTWANQDLFRLGRDGRPERITGAPADAFNPDGQRWDSPLYNWDRMEETGFSWWLDRLGVTLSRFDAVRLDHFIGFYNYYSFPLQKRDRSLPIRPDEPTGGLTPATPIDADGGFWTAGPKEKFLDAVFARFPKTSFIAEDLGVMTPGVHALRNHYELPGMDVLVFSYEGLKRNDRDPMTLLKKNAVACSGTHDTPTLRGWLTSLRKPIAGVPIDFSYVARVFAKRLPKGERPGRSLKRITNPKRVTPRDIDLLVRGGIRAVLHSKPDTALVPIQDFLNLDDTARMNFPGRSEGNWLWRLQETDLTPELAASVRSMIKDAERL